jgi:pathogenesis-related protein 1
MDFLKKSFSLLSVVLLLYIYQFKDLLFPGKYQTTMKYFFLTLVLGCFCVGQASPKTWRYAKVFELHNGYRANYRAPRLKWNNTLQVSAQKWADNCKFAHANQSNLSFSQRYGENLYAIFGRSTLSQALTDAAKTWYNEYKYYDYNRPGFSMVTGHFTQIVWVKTKSIGCGIKYCPQNKMRIVVCRYYPPGNVLNEFRQNVLVPKI